MPDDPNIHITHPELAHNVYRPKRMTTDDIRDGCIYLVGEDEIETRVCVVNEELRQGMEFIQQCEKSVTFWGSARLQPDNEYYQIAYEIARRVAQAGYAVVTGGGPGIMEAANKGAFDEGGNSVGITIKLPMEQTTNPYVKDEVPFYYFFTRKVVLSYSAEAYLFFPGGFGTMDELFEMLTLVQTHKIVDVPIVLVGEHFWKPLEGFIETSLMDAHETISPEDINLYTVTDDIDQIMDIVTSAPIRAGDRILQQK